MLMMMMFAAAVDTIIMKTVAAAAAAVVTSAASAVVVVIPEVVVGNPAASSSATMLNKRVPEILRMLYDDSRSPPEKRGTNSRIMGQGPEDPIFDPFFAHISTKRRSTTSGHPSGTHQN